MANGNCVTKLMKATDIMVKLTVFDDIQRDCTLNNWHNHLRLALGNCIFKEGIYILKIYNDHESLDPIGIMSTQEVYSVLFECFENPETFRMDIITPNSTVFSWIFALASDLSKKK